LSAATLNGYIIDYADERFLSDGEIVAAAYATNCLVVHDAAKELWNDREFVLSVVTQHGYSIEHASDIHKKDREIVLAAVTQDSTALYESAIEFRNDKEIVLASLTSRVSIDLMKNILEPNVLCDRDFAMLVVKQYGWILPYLPVDLRTDAEIIRCAVARDQLRE